MSIRERAFSEYTRHPAFAYGVEFIDVYVSRSVVFSAPIESEDTPSGCEFRCRFFLADRPLIGDRDLGIARECRPMATSRGYVTSALTCGHDVTAQPVVVTYRH